MLMGKINIIAIGLAGLIFTSPPSFGAEQQIEKPARSPKSASKTSEGTATSVFEKVSNSVVIVEAQRPQGKVQGSAVVYDSKSRSEYLTWEGEQPIVREGPCSYVVTNAHVIKNASRVLILHSGKRYQATIEYADEEIDLALLGFSGVALPASLPHSAAKLKVGEKVFAIGSPQGLENTISEGIISGKREENGVLFLQTTAPLSPGSSGGGLFDVKGRLVGITTFKVKDGENLNLAVDAGQIQKIETTLEAKGPQNSAMQAKPEVVIVVCHMISKGDNGDNLWDTSFKVDFTNRTVDGRSANFTDAEIVWKMEEKKHTFVHILNRLSGSINVYTDESCLDRGQCSLAGDRKF